MPSVGLCRCFNAFIVRNNDFEDNNNDDDDSSGSSQQSHQIDNFDVVATVSSLSLSPLTSIEFSGDFDKQSTQNNELASPLKLFHYIFLRGHTQTHTLSLCLCVSHFHSHYLRLFSLFRTVSNRIYISTYAERCCFLSSVFNISNLSENGFLFLASICYLKFICFPCLLLSSFQKEFFILFMRFALCTTNNNNICAILLFYSDLMLFTYVILILRTCTEAREIEKKCKLFD